MQVVYTHISEKNYVPREYSVAAIQLLLFMVLISLVSVLNLLYFYISTLRSMCSVPNMAVFCCSFIIIIRYGYLLSQAFSAWYFCRTSGDPHRSGFRFHTAVLSVLCVMFQV